MKLKNSNSNIKIVKSRLPISTRKMTSFSGTWPIKRNVNLHAHNFFELEIVTEGHAKTIINDTEYDLNPGTLYIMRPTDIHSITPIEGNTIIIRNFCFVENAVSDEVIDFLLSNAFDNIIKIPDDKLQIIYSLHDLIYKCHCENNSESNKICFKASELLLSIVVKEIKHSNIKVENKHVLTAINYMREHFTEDISIEDVSACTGLSAPYFSSVFHTSVGTKYKDYLTSLRVAHARKLIKTTNKSITDICYESGFNSFSSFHRAFVKIVHTTPAKYVRTTLPDFEPGKVRGHSDS